jgi:predicted CopG family antitoxin
MSTKTIALGVGAYEKLAAQKRDGESFTMTIERLLQGHEANSGTCGAALDQAARIWGKKGATEEADQMEGVIEQGRKSTRWVGEPLSRITTAS